MTEAHQVGVTILLASQEPPSASAIDEDIYLTVTTAVPPFQGQVEMIDIILSVDYAKHMIAQLSGAVAAAIRNEAH